MKDYPSFIIDRSRRSVASRFTDDFIVCTDKEVGFIARIYKVPKSRRNDFADKWAEGASKYAYRIIGDAMVVLEITQMLHEPIAHYNRLPPLMRKALKAYLYGEAEAVNKNGEPYDDQIAAIEEVLRMCESQHDRMVDMNGAESTKRFISALQAAAGSIALLKQMVNSSKA